MSNSLENLLNTMTEERIVDQYEIQDFYRLSPGISFTVEFSSDDVFE